MLDGHLDIDIPVKADEEDDNCDPVDVGITINGDDFEQIWKNSGGPGGVFIAYRPDYNLRVTAMALPTEGVKIQTSRQVRICENTLHL